MGCYIWYSEEGPRRAAASPSPLLTVPNVTPHRSTASVPTSYYSMWHYRPNCLWILKVEENQAADLVQRITWLYFILRCTAIIQPCCFFAELDDRQPVTIRWYYLFHSSTSTQRTECYSFTSNVFTIIVMRRSMAIAHFPWTYSAGQSPSWTIPPPFYMV